MYLFNRDMQFRLFFMYRNDEWNVFLGGWRNAEDLLKRPGT